MFVPVYLEGDEVEDMKGVDVRTYEEACADMLTAGTDTMVARLRKQSRRRRLNGRTGGRASTRSAADETSTA